MTASPQARLGTMVGRYRLVELLGSGGVGTVYRAVDTTLERIVAVKVLHEDSRLHGETKARFQREARLLSQLEHPNLCKVFDFLEDEEDALVLEFLDGHTLAAELEKHPSFERKLEIAVAVADALRTVHDRGILHRDLKPQNVMVQSDGTVKVLDFGLARAVESNDETLTLTGAPQRRTGGPPEASVLTRYGGVMGTPSFMSPEQARGEELTPATDLYSFGLLLLAMFSKRRAHPKELSTGELIERSRRGEYEAPEGLRSDLRSLALGLLEARPTDRPSAQAAFEALRAAAVRNRKVAQRSVLAAALLTVLVLGTKAILDLRTERAVALAAEARANSTVSFFVDMFKPVRAMERDLHDISVADMLERALEDFPETVPEDLATRVTTVRALGEALYELGMYQELDSLLDLVPESTLDKAGPADQLLLLRSQTANQLGDGEGAIRYASRQLELFPNVEVVRAQLLLTDYLKNQERFEEAIAMGQRALGTAQEMDQESERTHTFVASAYRALAFAHSSVGESEEAERLFREAIDYVTSRYGADHVRNGRLYSGLMSVAIQEGRKEDSVTWARRAYEVQRKAYGDDHPVVALAANNYAGRLGWVDRHDEAAKIGREGLEIRRRVYGDKHLRVAFSMESTGWSTARSGKIDEGRALLEQALEMRRELQGYDAEGLKFPLRLLGYIHRDMTRDYARAEEYFEEQLALAERRMAQELMSEGRSNALVNLAVLYHRAGWAERAEAAFPELLDVRIQEYGKDHRYVAQDAGRWVDFLRDEGRHEEALSVSERFGLQEERGEE